MSTYALSKFVPLPDISTPVKKTHTEAQSMREVAYSICSVDTVESFPGLDFCQEAESIILAGDSAFKAGNLREAVLAYTEVLKNSKDCCPSLSATCLAKRSAAFSMMSSELRLRPVDACSLYGMDALRLASLALKDGEKVKELFPYHSEGYLRCAFALYLSEKYFEALEMCKEGCCMNIEREPIRECIRLIDGQLSESLAANNTQTRARSNQMAMSAKIDKDLEDFECKLCFKLLYEPVTTPCGHSFCSACIQRSLDHSNKCPLCRTVMHASRSLPVSLTLKAIIARLFSEDYSKREAEMNALVSRQADVDTCFLPLFVLFTLFPGEKMKLNVFEPRYRLMIRRVMEGNRRFGMVQSCCQSPNGVCSTATECEVVECEPLADGRYFVEVIGRRRFEVIDLGELDGYRIARGRYFEDHPINASSQDLVHIEKHMKFIAKLEKYFRARGLLHRQSGLRWNIHERPNTRDLEEMSFVACALLVNPDGSSARRKYIDCRCTLTRLEWICQSVHSG